MAAATTSVSLPAEAPGNNVAGLAYVLSMVDDQAKVAARAWCADNSVGDVKLISELEAVEEFISALPIKPTGLAAKWVRKQLAPARPAA